MSTSTNVRPSRSSTVSIESRVVPGTSETITRSRPSSAFRSDDLPTFGRPRIATRIASSGSSGRTPPSLLEAIDEIVEQVAGAVAVHRGERDRVAEAEPVELERVRLLRGVVDLVRQDEHGLVREAEDLRDLLVARRRADARVDDEEHEVGLLDRLARLVRDRARDLGVVRDVDPAGVDHEEAAAVPLDLELLAVARHARRLVHDRCARLGQPVDERGLADVREADDRDGADQLVGPRAHGSSTCVGRPASCTSTSQRQSRWISRSTSIDASR